MTLTERAIDAMRRVTPDQGEWYDYGLMLASDASYAVGVVRRNDALLLRVMTVDDVKRVAAMLVEAAAVLCASADVPIEDAVKMGVQRLERQGEKCATRSQLLDTRRT